MKVAAPIPVVIRLADDLLLRGQEWSHDGPAVVFVHDLGDDLDVWATVAARLAGVGFRVISMDLPGHGLSDGEPDVEALPGQIVAMLGEVRASFGPVALVAYGAVAEVLLRLGSADGAPVQVLVSPSPLDPLGINWARTAPAMRLIISGTLNDVAHSYVAAIYPKIRGQRLMVTGASTATGPYLLSEQTQLVEHLILFVRQYLVPYQLDWIAAHTDEIKAAVRPEDQSRS